jgi:predicted nucleic-acid-binding Zn-ribbon protein
MALYCLCDAAVDIGYTTATTASNIPMAMRVTMSVLTRAMQCIKTGAEQYLTEIDRTTLQQRRRRHCPDFDIYECPKCGTRSAQEG